MSEADKPAKLEHQHKSLRHKYSLYLAPFAPSSKPVMSTTTSITTTETPQAAPPFTVLSRVASIPLVSSSLETIDHQLSSNAYTRSFYPTAKGLSSTAYKYTEPIQTRLAPLIVRADGYANKAVDVVEARYPYPFTVKPEDVTEYVRERRQSATDRIHHSIDETVKNPALNVATGIDNVGSSCKICYHLGI